MSNVVDYVKWRGDLSLEQSSFNELDSLILNRFSYFPLDNIIKKGEIVTIKELSERFLNEENVEVLWKDDSDLFPAIGQSRRFCDMQALDYINIIDEKKEKQFSAVTVLLPDDTIYVSFRGTDCTLIGWKEDFNMSFKSHMPSQVNAKEYLEQAALNYPNKKIRVGGHSKGGNLAMYAAIFTKKEVQDRIINVYNNDGPGFMEDIINTQEYEKIIDRVVTFIPQDSIFGLLLEHREKNVVVHSVEKGTMQHDVYSWQVEGTHFIVVNEITNGSKFIDKTITNWLNNLDIETRGQVIDIIFQIINSTNVKKVSELKLSIIKNAKTILSSYKQIDAEDRKMIMNTLTSLFGIIKDNAIEEFENRSSNKT